MNAVIIVLWRPGDPWRGELWEFAKLRWEETGLPIVECDHPDGLYAARNEGARLAGDWDVALFADADIVLGDTVGQTRDALNLAHTEGGYVAAFTELVALDRDATELVLAGGSLKDAAPWKRWASSWVGVYAIGRDLFDRLGGYDERFAPFSGQDVAIIQAASTLAHLERVTGLAVHLWHESSSVGHPPRHPDRVDRYEQATGDLVAMQELLEQ